MSIKKLLSCLLATAAICVLGSCEQDTYDTGTGQLSLTRGDLLDAQSDHDKTIASLVTDDDERMVLTNPTRPSWVTTADSTYRVLAYYDKTGEGKARLVSMSMIPTLFPIDISEVESPKTDPISFESLWVSGNRKYVNIGFYLMTGTPDEEAGEVKQTLGVMDEGVTTNADGTTTAKITIYHDQGGVPEYYSTHYYASVPVSSLHDADSVTLTVNSYKGMVVKTWSLK